MKKKLIIVLSFIFIACTAFFVLTGCSEAVNEPELFLSADKTTIMWNLNIDENIEYYNLYRDNELLHERYYDYYYNIQSQDKRSFRFKVEAIGKEGYKSSSAFIDINIDVAENVIDTGKITDEKYLLNASYVAIYEKELDLDALLTAKIIFKPIYNCIYFFECSLYEGNQNVLSAQIDGKDFDITRDIKIKSGSECIIDICYPYAETFTKPKFTILIKNFNIEEYSIVESGLIVYAFSPVNIFDYYKVKCYNSYNESLSFAFIEELHDEPIFNNQIFMSVWHSGYLLIRNNSDNRQSLTLWADKICADNNTGEIEIKTGYTNVEISNFYLGSNKHSVRFIIESDLIFYFVSHSAGNSIISIKMTTEDFAKDAFTLKDFRLNEWQIIIVENRVGTAVKIGYEYL